jgi:hypothetical protein
LLSLSLPDDLDQYAFRAPVIELPVRSAPTGRFQAVIGDRYHRLAAHGLSLQMRIGVVLSTLHRTGLAGAAVQLLAGACVRCQLLQPILVIGMQTALIIADQNNTNVPPYQSF